MKLSRLLAAFLMLIAHPVQMTADAYDAAEFASSAETYADDVRHEMENAVAGMVDRGITRWEIAEIKFPAERAVPEQFDSMKLDPSGAIRGKNLSYYLEFRQNGQIIKRLYGSAKLRLFADVLVATAEIDRDQLVQNGLVAVESREVSMPLSDLCTDFAEVEGYRAVRRIPAGRELSKSLVARPPDIMAGDIVMITAESEMIKVTAKGVARQDGSVGDMIQVINLRSNKKVSARVSGKSAVRVLF